MAGVDPEADTDDDDLDWRCYRHPNAAAGVRCRRCERPICPECMITAPVGFQCRECVRAAPAVRPLRSLQTRPVVTTALVAINAAVFLVSSGNGRVLDDFALFGPAVAAGEWWRIVTAGFLHLSIMHVGFNCLLLWQLGGLLEPVLGRWRFGLLYATALVGGSAGALLLEPRSLGAGASGAVFGLLGAGLIALRRRGISPMQSGLGSLLLINLVITFVVPGISRGAHLGGLVSGGAAGAVLLAMDKKHDRLVGAALVGALGIALVGVALWLASNPV